MKTKQSFLKSIIAIAVVASACSGQKTETTESGDNHDHMEAEAVAAPVTEIKTFENVDASVKSQFNGFLADYFSLNKSLIEDNQEGVKKTATKLAETIAKFDMSKLAGEQMDFYHAQLAILNDGLKSIKESADIEEARVGYAKVSEGMYALTKAYHPNESELYYQFCPMAKNGDGANWLSDTKEIINPYMGQRMLKCGSTKETL